MSSDHLKDVALLIDELRDPSPQLRLNSANKLCTISEALGPQRTRDELLPFLAASGEDEDEVLVAMAQQFGNMGALVGGADHLHCLLVPLETMVSAEESAVRDAATQSMKALASQMTLASLLAHLVPIVQNLAGGDWFTSRMSSCALLPMVYDKCAAGVQAQLRRTFAELCRDDMPSVRRCAASRIGELALLMEWAHVEQELLPIYMVLAHDEQESVRRVVLESTPAFLRATKSDAVTKEVLSVVVATLEDRSWRVRYCVAQSLVPIADAFGSPVAQTELLTPYTKLLEDGESEVRVAAAASLAGFCRHLAPDAIIATVVPVVKVVAGDPESFVRASVASSVLELAPLLGKSLTIDHLLDVFLLLLRDQTPEVRLNVITKLEHVNAVLDVEQLAESLLPAVDELTRDKAWRVRLGIIEKIPVLASQLGLTFYQAKLAHRTPAWLQDAVATIRAAASASVCEVSTLFGTDWTRHFIIPEIAKLTESQNYLIRITALSCLCALSHAVSPQTFHEVIVPLILGRALDAVPNVRFNVAKALQSLYTLVGSSQALGLVTPCLQQLVSDSDADVRFFAQQALLRYNSN